MIWVLIISLVVVLVFAGILASTLPEMVVSGRDEERGDQKKDKGSDGGGPPFFGGGDSGDGGGGD